MIEKNEKLYGYEYISEERAHAPMRFAEINPEAKKHVMRDRQNMLFSLRGDIPISLYDALDAKLTHEIGEFEKLMKHDAESLEDYKKRNKVLRSEYFVQRPLDRELL